jgi:hypothetical protein
MKLELFLLAITYFVVGNIYHEGKYLKILLDNKKYFHMSGVLLGAFTIYWLLKKNPSRAAEIISTSNEYIKHLPVDKDTSTILTPIFDITSKVNNYGGFSSNQNNVAEQRLNNSGRSNTTKRSVSETKKNM